MAIVTGTLLLVVACLGTALAACLLRSRRLQRELAVQSGREAEFRRLIDRAPVILWAARPDATLNFVNQTTVNTTGMSQQSLLEKGWLDAIHPDDRQRCIDIYTPAVEARQPFQLEYRIHRHDGAYVWFIDQGVPHFDGNGEFVGYVGSTIDVNDLKRFEQLLRSSQVELASNHREMQQLAGRLLTAHEDERRHLARELHDDLTQRLARLAIETGQLELQGGKDAVAMGAIRSELVRLSEDVHALSYRLHPSVLDDLGLTDALRTECDRVARFGRLRVDVSAQDLPFDLPRDVALCLFRIAQEALNNVSRHAQAKSVSVQLAQCESGIQLAVADDGRGFDADGSRGHPSLGLASMRERVRAVHGKIDIVSTSGGGTTVTAWVPVRLQEEST